MVRSTPSIRRAPNFWASFLGDIFFSSPVIDANGFVYVVYYAGSGLSKVVAFAPGGQEIWETEIEAVIDSSPVLTVDGHLLVGAFDGKLYALECGASLGYSQPWPRFSPRYERTWALH